MLLKCRSNRLEVMSTNCICQEGEAQYGRARTCERGLADGVYLGETRDIDIVIVKETVPGRLVRGITAMFKRIISALRVNRIIPGGPWNEAGIQMITQAKCPIIKLKTLQGMLLASGNTRMTKPLH
jgi:hypothetical protein